MLSHLLAFCFTFCAVFLKGFQHKNVIGGHLRAIVITSYLMAVLDAWLILEIGAKASRDIAFSCGSGAALGMWISVKYHKEILCYFGKVEAAYRKFISKLVLLVKTYL